MNLRSQLSQKIFAIQQKGAILHAPSTEVLSEERENFLDHQARLVWDAGAQILHDALKQIFIDKQRYRNYVPDDFFAAMKSASKGEFYGYSFPECASVLPREFPPKFVAQVWDVYLGNKGDEISDFMRHVISKLPEDTFKELITELKYSENKKSTITSIINRYFRDQFRGSLNMISLKHWLWKTGGL